jgi:hypothetical protein
MVYDELMKQADVYVPLGSLQDMVFAQLFMNKCMDSTGSSDHHHYHHHHTLHSTKDRKYWMETIWPCVVGQLLNRNPYVIIDDTETSVRWKSSFNTRSNSNPNAMDSSAKLKKRKMV